MARNEADVPVPPEAVWEVLADPRLYPTWVVGASTVREIEGRWPEPGSVLHHAQGGVLPDSTTALESEPGRRLVLEARARPLLVARVEVTLEPRGEGTHIVLVEEATGGFGASLPEGVVDRLIELRNRETIRRLARQAEIGWKLRGAGGG